MYALLRPLHRPRRRALSLAELLVVLAIIALVTVIAIPTVTSQMERARISSAMADCRALAQAEDACAAIHGVYVPLQVLDDLPEPENTTVNEEDTVRNETNIRLIDPLVPANQQIAGNPAQPQLATTDARGRQVINDWAGPFIEFRRAVNQPNPSSESDQRRDFPIDPWGQPYRFFSGEGAIGTSEASSTGPIDHPEDMTSSGFGSGVLTTNIDRFDRYAIVSTGRDLEVDNINVFNEEGDDIVHMFGIVGYETGLLSRFPSHPINTTPNP